MAPKALKFSERLRAASTEVEEAAAAAKAKAKGAAVPHGRVYNADLVAATARGRVGGARTAELTAMRLAAQGVVEAAEVLARYETEQQAAAAGELEAWQASVAARRVRMEESVNAAVEAAVSGAVATTKSELTVGATGRHTVSADLGDISYGMSSAEKPFITLDGLPMFWVASVQIPTSISKRVVLDAAFDVVPAGQRSHVHLAAGSGTVTVWMQSLAFS